MLARRLVSHVVVPGHPRRAIAALELAVCLPLMFLLLAGLWEVGRIVEVQNVMWNSARESARDCSLGQDNLLTVANNLLTYLQAAEPRAFAQGHSTSMVAPTSKGITLASNRAMQPESVSHEAGRAGAKGQE